MALAQDVKSLENATSRITQINELLAPYIPQQDTWNPADKSLYQPIDLYRVPVREAREMQLNAIKFTFIHHYNNNYFYHKYCEMRNVRPEDIKTLDDLDKIPLVPDATFKQYPSGKDFARWLATMFTGKLPKIIIKGATPTHDEVINAFNAAGMAIMYSSGTSGRCTIIPRDQKTFLAAECVVAKLTASMTDQTADHTHLLSADHIYLLSPNPKKTNLFIGKASSLSFDLIKSGDVQYAMDREITIELLQMAMSPKKGLKGKVISFVQNRTEQKIIDRTIQWLERYDRTKETIVLSGPPFMLLSIMNTLQKDGKHFDFGERSMVVTGGGWKINEYARVPHTDFRKQV